MKYTYAGDLNLDGKIDNTDLAHMDEIQMLTLQGYYNIDLNYDGKVNITDYTIYDENKVNQSEGVL